MKKVLAILLLVTVLFFSSSNAFSAAKIYLKDIKYTKYGSQDIISIYSTNYKGFIVYYLSNPDRIIVDLPNNVLSLKDPGKMKINSALVKSIRYSQFTKKTARVVFDVNSKPQYKVEQKSGYLKITFGKQTTTVVSTPVTSTDISRGDIDRYVPATNAISYSSDNDGDRVTISGGNHAGYTSIRLTDPDRIIIDIPSCIVPANQQDITGSMNLIKNIKYSQVDAKTARLTIDTNGQPQYELAGEQNQLILTVKNPTYKNILYSNIREDVHLTLNAAQLTEIVQPSSSEGSVDGTASEAEGIKKLFSESMDASGEKYTITFPTALADIGTGILQINDNMLDSVEITNDIQNQTTSIIFNSKYERKYDVITNPDTNQTTIAILKPFTKNDKLVVIDAGHGGYDPGAFYAGIKEKDLNLKVALKVDDILKSKGIKTYMTRTDDTFVPLYDRANIANDLNAAFFLSIHHNAYNTSEKGTETLYYPSVKSREFARIVQNTLINALGTKNRGIIERPNLVVLHATKMPATLAELGFITNSDDRQKILSDEFMQNAALALSEAVIKALDTIAKTE